MIRLRSTGFAFLFLSQKPFRVNFLLDFFLDSFLQNIKQFSSVQFSAVQCSAVDFDVMVLRFSFNLNFIYRPLGLLD